MFQITQGKGFQITFENGNTISVQWGYGNYGDNKYKSNGDEDFVKHQTELGAAGSLTAEVGAWDANSDWLNWVGDDGIAAYQKPEQVLEIMLRVAYMEPAIKK